MSRLFFAAPFLLFAACADTTKPANEPPPPWGVPISGGNMLVTRDGKHAVIADPDRDRILSVDLASNKVTGELALRAGDEPGRLIEDSAGRIHIALRHGTDVITLADVATAELGMRRAACVEPRGLAYDASSDSIHVACASGDLATLPAAGGEATRRLRIERDLRDVVVRPNGQLLITKFRSAEALTIDANGVILKRTTPPVVQRSAFGGGGLPPDFGNGGTGSGSGNGLVDAVAAVAWKTIALPDGRVLMTHQRQLKTKLSTEHGGYGQGCGQGPVEDAMTMIAPDGTATTVAPFLSGALPVDAAVSPGGDKVAFVTAGSGQVHQIATAKMGRHDDDDCGEPGGGEDDPTIDDRLGTPTSVNYAANGDLLIYYPELPALVVHTGLNAHTITLPGPLGYDAGRGMFHSQTGVGLACASCHPEGRDDGLVWQFDVIGDRRTQSLAGGIMDRGPYHWAGDMADLPTLMNDVFSVRMAGGEVTHSQMVSLGPWLDRVRAAAPPPAADPQAVARGKALFESDAVGCNSCHNGDLYTNSFRVNVGTGGMFKVPSLLGVGSRAPYMHTGCAASLQDRFGACGGGDLHGKTAALAPSQIADLVSFLETL